MALDGATAPGASFAVATGGDGRGRLVMRAVSFFGLGWIGTSPKSSRTCALEGGLASDAAGGTAAGIGRGCKTRESGGRGDNGGGRNGAKGRVVSGFWGSAGSMTNQVAPGLMAKKSLLSLAKLGRRACPPYLGR